MALPEPSINYFSRSTISEKTHWCLGQKADFKKYDFRQDSLMFGTESRFQEVRFHTRLIDVRNRKRISRSSISDKTLWCLGQKADFKKYNFKKSLWCVGQKADFKKYEFRQAPLVFETESGFQEVRLQTCRYEHCLWPSFSFIEPKSSTDFHET